MPSLFRFSLTNKTGRILTGLRVIGVSETELNHLGINKTLNFSLHDYDEKHNINLIYKNANRSDTVHLADGMTNSNGYFYKFDLKILNAKLIKE
jgi:hypothetical protein